MPVVDIAACNASEHGQGRAGNVAEARGLTTVRAEAFCLRSSLPGLTRQSILLKKMDARVEPAHDGGGSGDIHGYTHRRRCRHPSRPRHFTKRGSAALGLLDGFVDSVNAGNFDAVIDLGDRISDETAERDVVLQREIARGFRRLGNKPRHHLIGNHDVALLSAEENAAILDAPLHTRAAIVGGHRIAFWQPDVKVTAQRGFISQKAIWRRSRPC